MRSLLTKLTFAAALVTALSTGSAHAQAMQPFPPPPPPPYVPPPPPRYAYQPYRPQGFFPYVYFGGSLGGTGILTQSGGPEALGSGGGGALFLGGRILPRFALELGVLDSFHNPAPTIDRFGDYAGTSYVVLSGLTASALFHFVGPDQVIDPYVLGGLGVFALGRDVFGTTNTGWGYQAGGGIDFWLGRSLTLGARVLYRGISMSEAGSGQPNTFIHALTGEATLALHFR